MNNVYMNDLATVLPNQPVPNNETDYYIGTIGEDMAKVKNIVPGRNGTFNSH